MEDSISSEQSLAISQLDSTNVFARPPNRTSFGRCKIKCCIDKKKPGGKIFTNLQTNSGAIFSNSSTTFRDISLAQSWQKKKLNSASTFQICSGT
jgi:hypothetical protein